MKSLLALATVLFSFAVQAVTITGQQVSPTEWTYTVTYEPWDNYAVCPPPGDFATVTLTGLSGLVYAVPPTSTDIDTVTSDAGSIDSFNSVNLAWVPEVLSDGTEVRWTHLHPGTGNWSVPIHIFGFRVFTAAPAISGTVSVVSQGFSTDVSVTGPCPVQPADDRNFTGTTEGPVAIPLLQVSLDIQPGNSPNTINPKSKSETDLAILSAPGFDAPSQVALNSLTFGRTGREQSLAAGARAEDVNGDGLLDLVCHFHTPSAHFQPGDTHGILTGHTVHGVRLEGTDAVTIVMSQVTTGRGGAHRPAFPGRGRF
jgi:hypothetical protein